MKLECTGFVNFQPENIRQGIYGLVTIVLERAWAALKCDQLPVGPRVQEMLAFKQIIHDFLFLAQVAILFIGAKLF